MNKLQGLRNFKRLFSAFDRSRNSKFCTMAQEFVEKVVCNENELSENQMKAFELTSDRKVLVVKQNGKISAVGHKCTHYGAPLDTGVLGDGVIRCPWHGACFQINTGDIEDFPGLDSLPCYQVNISASGEVKVTARKEDLQSTKRIKPMAKRDNNNNETYVIVGAGAAGATCAETLRQENFTGRIVLIGNEKYVPYDRIKLSKILSLSPETAQLRTSEYYKEHDIELLLNSEVVSMDDKEKSVTFTTGNDSKTLSYDKLFVATGSKPRSVPEASKLKNIFTLRNINDGHTIADCIKSSKKSMVIIGSSFIGMEVAAYSVDKCESVTVVGPSKFPFATVLGEKIGERIQKWFEEKGIKFVMNTRVKKIEQSKDELMDVVLEDGSTLNAGVIVVGIGGEPNTQFLVKPNITATEQKYIEVDEYLETSVKGIYAGGDIAFAPVLGTKAAIGHWQLSQYHGRIAALNMVGKATPLSTVPFFWTMLFGKGIRYAGFAPKFDDVIVQGSLQDLKFTAYFCDTDHIVRAIATMGMDPLAAKFAEYLAQKKTLKKLEVLGKNPLIC